MNIKLDGVKIGLAGVYLDEGSGWLQFRGIPRHPTAFFRQFTKGLRRRVRKQFVKAGHRDLVLLGL